MVVPSGIRYLARWRFALLRYQPPMETGEADLLYSSIASSRGSMECERTSLTTTLSSGRKLLSPGVGVAGKRTMLVLPSGRRPSERPTAWAGKLIPSSNTPRAEEMPMDSPELLSLKFV